MRFTWKNRSCIWLLTIRYEINIIMLRIPHFDHSGKTVFPDVCSPGKKLTCHNDWQEARQPRTVYGGPTLYQDSFCTRLHGKFKQTQDISSGLKWLAASLRELRFTHLKRNKQYRKAHESMERSDLAVTLARIQRMEKLVITCWFVLGNEEEEVPAAWSLGEKGAPRVRGES